MLSIRRGIEFSDLYLDLMPELSLLQNFCRFGYKNVLGFLTGFILIRVSRKGYFKYFEDSFTFGVDIERELVMCGALTVSLKRSRYSKEESAIHKIPKDNLKTASQVAVEPD